MGRRHVFYFSLLPSRVKEVRSHFNRNEDKSLSKHSIYLFARAFFFDVLARAGRPIAKIHTDWLSISVAKLITDDKNGGVRVRNKDAFYKLQGRNAGSGDKPTDSSKRVASA